MSRAAAVRRSGGRNTDRCNDENGVGGMSEERAGRFLEAAGFPPGSLVACRPMSGGTYNTVEELRLTDGSRYMLKIPPPPTVPGMSHERELLVSEAEFYRAAATVDVPAPRSCT